jgi:hypothetical protein
MSASPCARRRCRARGPGPLRAAAALAAAPRVRLAHGAGRAGRPHPSRYRGHHGQLRPDFEYRVDPVWVKAGLLEPYRGAAEYHRYIATVDEVWGGENYLTLTDVIDAHGDIELPGSATGRA